MKTSQYQKLIQSYRRCLYWNNEKVKTTDLNKFMSLYLKMPEDFKKDSRNYLMFHFPFVSNKFWKHLPKKIQAKRKRVLKNLG